MPQKKKKNTQTLIKKVPQKNKNTPQKLLGFGIVVIIGMLISYEQFFNGSIQEVQKDVGLNEVQARYLSGVYETIEIRGTTLQAHYPETTKIQPNSTQPRIIKKIDEVELPNGASVADLGLVQSHIPTKVIVEDATFMQLLKEFLPTLLSLVLFLVGGLFLFSRMSGGQNGPMAFIRSRAKIYEPEDTKDVVTFADVAGSIEEKEELREVVEFLRDPKRFQKLGAKIPRGILMAGPPGTGKTLLARAVAGEAHVPFFSISGSEFVEMFVGVGAARVRDLFREARERAPAIIFIDEIDAIGKRRSPGVGGGHDEREQTLNQILTEMDGFDNETHVIVLAATNRVDVLDQALLRPGRFDRKVAIRLPTLEDRIKILEVHAKNKPLDPDVKLAEIASNTVGFAGADLGNLLNEAAILAGKLHASTITQKMIQGSIEKILMGTLRSSLIMSPQEKKITAYHEIGHALVGRLLPHTDPVHKISILSRGQALGVTWFLPEKDTVLVSKAKYLDELATLYGGRVAEELFFGEENITTGASNDIERATQIARNMVMRYGFYSSVGVQNFFTQEEYGPGSSEISSHLSSHQKEKIDTMVHRVLEESYALAKKIITESRDLHIQLSELLLQKEELLKDEFEAIIRQSGKVLP